MQETDIPALPRGVRLHHDQVRETWVLLAPERAITLDAIGHAILNEVDGIRSFERRPVRFHGLRNGVQRLRFHLGRRSGDHPGGSTRRLTHLTHVGRDIHLIHVEALCRSAHDAPSCTQVFRGPKLYALSPQLVDQPR